MIEKKTRITMKKVDGCGLTPTIIFKRLKGSHKFLFETNAQHISSGRYSFLGVNPRKTYSGYDSKLHEMVYATDSEYHYDGDLVQLLKQVMPRISNETSYPFTGGAVGYLRFNRNEASIPAVNFHVYDTILLFDHLTEELIGIHTDIDPERTASTIDDLLEQVLNGESAKSETYGINEYEEQYSLKELQATIKNLKREMAQSAAEKVILTRKLSAHFEGNAFSYYREFRKNAPSAYQYYIEFDDHIVIGSAEEPIIQVLENRVVATENTVLPILEKNSVQTIDDKTIGRLSGAYHPVDVLAQALPTQSAVGHPFDEAYFVLERTELDERLLYGGAVGYIGFNGQLNFAHANHSVVIQNSVATKEVAMTIQKDESTFQKGG